MENPRDNPRDKPKDKSKDMPKDKPKEKDGKSKSEDHFIFNSTDNIDYAEFNDTTSSKSPIDGAKLGQMISPKADKRYNNQGHIVTKNLTLTMSWSKNLDQMLQLLWTKRH